MFALVDPERRPGMIFFNRPRPFAEIPAGGNVAQAFAASLRGRMGQQARVTIGAGGAEPTGRAIQSPDEHDAAIIALRKMLAEVSE